MFELLLLVGTALFGFACRTFDSIYLRKLGTLAYIATSYLIFYFITGSAALGGIGIALWFCLPWIELLTRVRAMRLPIERPLRRRYPPKALIFMRGGRPGHSDRRRILRGGGPENLTNPDQFSPQRAV